MSRRDRQDEIKLLQDLEDIIDEEYDEEEEEEKPRKVKKRKKDNKVKKLKNNKKSDGKKKDTKVIALETTLSFKAKLFITIIVLAALAAGCVFVLNTKFKTKELKVVGNTWHSDEEIIKHLKTSKYDKYSVFFKLRYLVSDPPEMAFVEKFDIKLEGTDKVTIRVFEKNIVGCIYEMNDYLYFDKDGYIISNKTEQVNHVPRIEGLDYTELAIGKKLRTSNDKIFNVILSLTQNIDKYNVDIESIVFDSNFKVTLLCFDGNKVFIGKKDRYDEVIQALPKILTAAEESGKKYWMDMSEFTASNNKFIGKFLDEKGNPIETPVNPEPEEGQEGEGQEEGEGQDA